MGSTNLHCIFGDDSGPCPKQLHAKCQVGLKLKTIHKMFFSVSVYKRQGSMLSSLHSNFHEYMYLRNHDAGSDLGKTILHKLPIHNEYICFMYSLQLMIKY